MLGRYCTWVHRAGKDVCIDLPLPDGKCKATYVHTYSTYITECLIDKIYIFAYYENVLAFIIKTKSKFHSTVFISFISAIY